MPILQEELDQLAGTSITTAAKKAAVVSRELKFTGDRVSDAAKVTGEVADMLSAEGTNVYGNIDTFSSDLNNIVDFVKGSSFVRAKEIAQKIVDKLTISDNRTAARINKIGEFVVAVNDHTVETHSDIGGIIDVNSSAQKAATILMNSVGATAATSIVTAFDRQMTAVETAMNVNILTQALGSQVSDFQNHLSEIQSIMGHIDVTSRSVGGISVNLLANAQQMAISLVLGNSNVTNTLNLLNSVVAATSTLFTSARNFVDSQINSAVNRVNTLINNVKDSIAKVLGLRSASNEVSKAALKAVGKIMGKLKKDLPFYAVRPISKGDTKWPTPPGSELPKEARAIANHEPSVRIWNKSAKGHSLHVDDHDGLERLQITDRSGSVMLFDAPLDPKENEANKEQRGSRSVLTGDQIEREKMRDLGGKIIIQDLAQSQIEFDSRDGFEKITIVANDGEGGIHNGKNRQKMEILSGSNRFIIESVKDGKVQARFSLDANSGVVTIEAETFVTLKAPYISLNGEHINLNGRVCVNGDMVTSGRQTGGN